MRLTRIKTSTAEQDELEHNWWNTNSDLIETIWANSYSIQKAIRLPYLKRMKQFFLKDAKSLPVKILEVGCGTGWVCRLIADNDFHVVGTDFSESQINRAKQEALHFKKSEFCTYQLADASTFDKEYDGVVIHALLHHLTK
jgi:2-polyprenyl-3-methyl-5-hydroxy-6-metoxy-1,4-benzoquinol methylase